MMVVGSTYSVPNTSAADFIVETMYGGDDSEDEMSIEPEVEFDGESWMDNFFEQATAGKLDFDDIMASATHARRSQGMDAEHLSVVWQISVEEANWTLGITMQDKVHTDNPKLGRFLFMDTFYATKVASKSTTSRHMCCQLFVMDKGFICVVPMQSKGNVLAVVKQFAKEIRVPDALISNAAGQQKSNELREFRFEIGMMLQHLEDGTLWANRAKLYIRIIMDESVHMDMKELSCPLPLLDYSVKRRARTNNLTAKQYPFNLHRSNAYTILTGEEADISTLCKYGWYGWCNGYRFVKCTAWRRKNDGT